MGEVSHLPLVHDKLGRYKTYTYSLSNEKLFSFQSFHDSKGGLITIISPSFKNSLQHCTAYNKKY